MRVKRYVVDSMPDALQKIRSDLGKDAVILNTKEIRSGGFLGLFGKKRIEVIAATDSSSGAAASQAKPSPLKPIVPQQRPAAVATLDQERRSDFPDVPDVLIPVKKEPAAPPVLAKEPVPAPSAFAAVYAAAQQASTPTQSSGTTAQTAVATAAVAAKPKEELLLEEIKQMKEMMRKLTLSANAIPELPEPLQRLERRLLDQEVDVALVESLIAQVQQEAAELEEPITDEAVQSSIRRQLRELLVTGANKRISTETRVVHFVGPTGVGKTTTIAKLAAEQVLKFQRKVGFITSDTYRIAAIEQLKTYATILNVPIEVVFSPQDLAKAFHQLEGCDVIFMDTAGRNFRNEMYVSELNALLKTQGQSETILVLSLTTKYKDMRAITNNFNKFKLDKVLFTKMDETDSYGSILNLIHDFSLQLSYVTNGQSVPDDISEIDEKQIIDLLLEDRDHD
ncbi:flagellar biosynthesis protein FlhF [Paenibacillus athensensis]|uniref:Flagellar biosynthesis protein FlhF n=1 Tax=Paenibacillus athensensis TaxID=1967502 RepID=A0A4Y8QBU2_9BACL|nr:flagellar biosynthesis protein FlhF [Paenibacillus athensensis]MCD1257802.1 flagellar biosynthesis protein FlhF [Paenibacillus athensensis]